MAEVAFDGTRSALRSYLKRMEGAYYTYLLAHPDGRPFYVGKGKGLRVLQHELEALRQSNLPRSNLHKCNTIRQIVSEGGQLRYQIDRVYDEANQLSCLEREAELIATYRRRCDGGLLTNLAGGLGNLFGLDPESAARHAATLSGIPHDNPERAALNLYLRSIGDLESVPIKPLSQYRSRLVPAQPSPKNLTTVSRRNCYCLIASALAEGLTLTPGVHVPRAFTLYPDFEEWPLPGPAPDEVRAVIENGAASDVLKVGLATLIPAAKPENEAFLLNAAQIARLTATVGRDALTALGL